MILSEIHIIGLKTRERIVSPAECPALAEQGIRLCGLSDTAAPYRMERPKLEWAESIVTLSGEGRAWVGGHWQTIRAGDAYLSPHGSSQGFYPAPGRRWRTAWVHLDRPSSLARPVVVKADGVDLAAMIGALHHEALGPRDVAIMAHLASLIHLHVVRLGGSAAGDLRLRQLWREVDGQLARPWTVDLLASRARMSGEHLRRLCLAERGCAPMEHVTSLRMQRAASLLRASHAKVETVAVEVGYGSIHAFSTAFRRWSGLPPRAWREAGQETGQ